MFCFLKRLFSFPNFFQRKQEDLNETVYICIIFLLLLPAISYSVFIFQSVSDSDDEVLQFPTRKKKSIHQPPSGSKPKKAQISVADIFARKVRIFEERTKVFQYYFFKERKRPIFSAATPIAKKQKLKHYENAVATPITPKVSNIVNFKLIFFISTLQALQIFSFALFSQNTQFQDFRLQEEIDDYNMELEAAKHDIPTPDDLDFISTDLNFS